MQNWPIWRKLALSFLALVVTFGGVSALIVTSVTGLEKAQEEKANAYAGARATQTLLYLTLEQMNAVRGFTILGQDAFYETYVENRDKVGAAVEEIRTVSQGHDFGGMIDEYSAATAEWQKDKLEPTIALARDPATRAEAQELAGKKQLSRIRDAIKALDAAQKARVEAADMEEAALRNQVHWALGVGIALMLALAGGLAWLLNRSIANPIADIVAKMRSLAEGDHNVEAETGERRDEIGDMGRALHVFRDAAIAKEAAEMAKRADEAAQKQIVDLLSGALQRLSAGDVSHSIDADVAPAYRGLRDDYNTAVAGLRNLVGAVSTSVEAIRSGTNEIASATNDLARRTESNAASIEETAAAVTQIDGSVRANTDAASQTVTRASRTHEAVESGRSVADEAMQAMTRVSESARGIDDVIEGLDKIAFQTRVLAMNAAVEAGRAGEAGRGFAVVADLVSALAMRAEEESKQAREQLTATQVDIEGAVQAVRRVDAALVGIATDVEEVNNLLGTVAEGSRSQATAISEVSGAIQSLDSATQQNAAMVEQTSAAAQTLSTEADRLAQHASAFQPVAQNRHGAGSMALAA
ncbi:methyl-accepting chemotaxis protein [Sphingomonas sp.]|uniref:methyl-accepting chemotaxis protein n=1 Tax=Sphingomonas sp. TaxID=28214 RepID=UPI00307D4F1D